MKGRISRMFLGVTAGCVLLILYGCGSAGNHAGAEEGECLPAAILEKSPLLSAENPEQENMADLLQRAASGTVVQVQAGRAAGSGVLWKVAGDKLVIVTAGHVMAQTDGERQTGREQAGDGQANREQADDGQADREQAGDGQTNRVQADEGQGSKAKRAGQEIRVSFADGSQAEAADYAVDAETDLAFLSVSVNELSGESLSRLFLANVDEECLSGAQGGDGLILMGSVTEAAGDAYEGKLIDPWIYVEDFAQYMMLAEVNAEPGMSGGGVFDYHGHFLGILCGGDADGEAAVLPVSVIASRYESISENF